MDLVKTGKFIQQQRKLKNLTQVQLAQKIGVSEKNNFKMGMWKRVSRHKFNFATLH